MLRRLRHALGRYTGLLRTLKPVYVVANLLNRDKLAHNRALYDARGLRRKSVVAPVRAADFAEVDPQELPWLDRPGALEALRAHLDFGTFPAVTREAMEGFVADGYLILRGFFSPGEVRTFNLEVDRLLEEGRVATNFTGRKIMNAHRESELLEVGYYRHPELLRMLAFLLGRPVRPFQSITFTAGSEQRAHSDSVHMMTDPPGFLIATWTAFEATGPDNGALFYYPGSHRLPIVTTADFDSGNTALRVGADANARYEDAIARLVAEHDLHREEFVAQPGDLLIWHANLLHGGSPIGRPGSSRRSMVGHYFGEDVVCYHELTHRPALMVDG